MPRNLLSITLTILLLCSAGYAFSADVGGKDAQKELEKLQGTWVLTYGEIGGKKASDAQVKKAKVIHEGNKITLMVPNQTPETIKGEIVKIDRTKNPKQFQFIRKNGPSAGKLLTAIYVLRGKDRFDFAFDPAGKVILKEFATKKGTGHVLNSWKRVKQ